MSINEKQTMTFKVQSFRKIPNPYLKSENGEKGAEMYVAICDVKIFLPSSLWKLILVSRR